jgi:pyruvate ferredoxin oxidoreductase alpha subunit
LWSENAQEAYDNIIQAFRIGEHMDIRLPVMVCLDGFIISHSIERLEYLEDGEVTNFISDFKELNPLLDMEHPVSYGPLILPDYYMEFRKAQDEVESKVSMVVLEAAKDFEKISGRKYGLFETYRLDDAEIGMVILNSAAGTSKDTIDEFRNRGIKAGLLKPRLYRPFPYKEKPILINKIYGLGGRDYLPEHAEHVLSELAELAKTGKVDTVKEYIGVRG